MPKFDLLELFGIPRYRIFGLSIFNFIGTYLIAYFLTFIKIIGFYFTSYELNFLLIILGIAIHAFFGEPTKLTLVIKKDKSWLLFLSSLGLISFLKSWIYYFFSGSILLLILVKNIIHKLEKKL